MNFQRITVSPLPTCTNELADRMGRKLCVKRNVVSAEVEHEQKSILFLQGIGSNRTFCLQFLEKQEQVYTRNTCIPDSYQRHLKITSYLRLPQER